MSTSLRNFRTLSVFFLAFAYTSGGLAEEVTSEAYISDKVSKNSTEAQEVRFEIPPFALEEMMSSIGSDQLCVDHLDGRLCAVTPHGKPITKNNNSVDQVMIAFCQLGEGDESCDSNDPSATVGTCTGLAACIILANACFDPKINGTWSCKPRGPGDVTCECDY